MGNILMSTDGKLLLCCASFGIAAVISAIFYFFMMSTDSKKLSDDATMITMCCDYCGIAEGDDIKLKDCDGGCDHVKYCSKECNELDRLEHDVECKKKKQEIRDKDLFEQPDESHLGDCPICCLPIPLDDKKSTTMRCCCKILCRGCAYANAKREFEMKLEQRCPFCREPTPDSSEEFDKDMMKRAKKKDPIALREVAEIKKREGDIQGALEYWTKAAELGNASAHFNYQ